METRNQTFVGCGNWELNQLEIGNDKTSVGNPIYKFTNLQIKEVYNSMDNTLALVVNRKPPTTFQQADLCIPQRDDGRCTTSGKQFVEIPD